MQSELAEAVADRHLYDHIVYDSSNERDFAAELDTNTDVALKLGIYQK